MRAALAVVVLVFLACGKKDLEATPDASPTVTSKPKPPWPSDTPDRNAACEKHDDCAVLMHDAILPPDPCCTQRVGFLPVHRKYAEATSAFQQKLCAGVKCAPSPLPGAEPLCCASIGRCVNKKCIGGCDDPTLDAPKVVWHEMACRARFPE